MKKTKIYVGRDLVGRFTCDGKRYTRFQYLVYRVKCFIRRTTIVSAGLSIIGWSMWLGSNYKANTVYAEIPVDVSEEILQGKISDLKDEVANTLMACESGSATEDTGLVTFDPLQSNPNKTATRNIPSFGQFQFKIDTVIGYYEILYSKKLTQKEAILLALDTNRAKELATRIMFETKSKAGKDWINCNKKHNLDARIDLIKELEK